MQIQMTGTYRGSNDGFTVCQFHEGIIYSTGETIGHTLACSFIQKGRAKEIKNWQEKYEKNSTGWLECLDYLKDHLPFDEYVKAYNAVRPLFITYRKEQGDGL